MAAKLQHPFQRIQFFKPASAAQKLLVAAAGPKLYCYAAETGRRLSVWPQDQETANGQNSNIAEKGTNADGQEPPGKKRKISPSADEPSSDSKPNTKETGKSQSSSSWSHIPLLVTSPTGKYIVAVTPEDKCIRVFEVSEDGVLQQVSERHMPKRPSVISLTPDGNTILCGDKFGDVYSLPLIPGDKPVVQAKPSIPKPFQPAATNLTVHTKRNLEALEQQLRMGSKSVEERAPQFEHKLLLGHVSMLSGLTYVSLPSPSSAGQSRSYLLTGDRDEHIRVSRGIPQTHVIENYCFGHTSFITQMCIPEWQPEILVSGGGDDYLLVWKWQEGRVLQKVSLLDEKSESREIAVRSIWALQLSISGKTVKVVLVATEGSSKLLCYTMEADGQLRRQPPAQLSSNVLDVAYDGANDFILVSLDGVHEPDSTQMFKENETASQLFLQTLRVVEGQDGLAFETVEDTLTSSVNSEGTTDVITSDDEKAVAKSKKDLTDALYGLGNLRKRANGEEE
ncbi:tRNA (guanine-N(7)-)-methyltransferase non-catalytic subunit trm82 [Paecilomyces lecythidis]|uniref:tRNA (Guanine-N(7)-)-methyltransferase non-catalytic subunit trm82 n=1 Tax=Paecilomyces lecythidis TaxID=3004212 RepID=A0ABR3XY33_9EURO